MASDSPYQPRWPWLRLVLVPLGWLGALLLAMLLLGVVLLWRFPSLASKYQVELRDLVVRAIEPHWGDPFYILKGRDAWEKFRLNWQVSDDGAQKMGDLHFYSKHVKDRPHRYEHQITKQGSKTVVYTKLSTTPNLNVPLKELEKARSQLKQFFPGNEDHVKKWGQVVFYWWMLAVEDRLTNNPERITPNLGLDLARHIQAPEKDAEDEFYWCAWKQLCADLPSAESDLPRLSELVRKAYPKSDEYQAAMKWASTLYTRLDETFQEWNRTAGGKLGAALPPKCDFTYHWLLYQYVGLTDETSKVIRDRWLSYFRSGKKDAVKEWGQKLEEKRRKDGEVLPPASDNVTLLCIIERIRGTDAIGEKCRRVVVKEVSASSSRIISKTISLGAYPNDDFYTVFAGNDPFQLYEIPAARWIIVVCQLMMLIGLRVFLFSVFAEQLLKLKDSTLYLQYRARKPFYRDPTVLGTYLIVPFFGWLGNFLTIPTDLALTVSPFQRLLGTYLSVWLGGTMLSCLTKSVAILMIKAGYDPEKSWLDEGIGLPMGIFILFHFQNDLPSILTNVLIDLIPEAQRKLEARGGVRPVPVVRAGDTEVQKGKVDVATIWEQRSGKRSQRPES